MSEYTFTNEPVITIAFDSSPAAQEILSYLVSQSPVKFAGQRCRLYDVRKTDAGWVGALTYARHATSVTCKPISETHILKIHILEGIHNDDFIHVRGSANLLKYPSHGEVVEIRKDAPLHKEHIHQLGADLMGRAIKKTSSKMHPTKQLQTAGV